MNLRAIIWSQSLPAKLVARAVAVLGCLMIPMLVSAQKAPDEVRGTPIGPAPRTITTNPAARATATNSVGTTGSPAAKSPFASLGFDNLSSFPYEVVEVVSTNTAGRPLTRSNHKIPDEVKKWDSQKVAVTGFVLPLRTKKGKVTEFLLMRDQGACCFGATPQMNHWVRVKFPEGFSATPMVPATVSGTLHVGEVFEQGYLTGIYRMDAEKVGELGDR